MRILKNDIGFTAVLRDEFGALIAEGFAKVNEEQKEVEFRSDFIPLYTMNTTLEIARTVDGKDLHVFLGKVFISAKTILRLVDVKDAIMPDAYLVYSNPVNIYGAISVLNFVESNKEELFIKKKKRQKMRYADFVAEQEEEAHLARKRSTDVEITVLSGTNLEFTCNNDLYVGDEAILGFNDCDLEFRDIKIKISKIYTYGSGIAAEADIIAISSEEKRDFLDYVKALCEKENRFFAPEPVKTRSQAEQMRLHQMLDGQSTEFEELTPVSAMQIAINAEGQLEDVSKLEDEDKNASKLDNTSVEDVLKASEELSHEELIIDRQVVYANGGIDYTDTLTSIDTEALEQALMQSYIEKEAKFEKNLETVEEVEVISGQDEKIIQAKIEQNEAAIDALDDKEIEVTPYKARHFAEDESENLDFSQQTGLHFTPDENEEDLIKNENEAKEPNFALDSDLEINQNNQISEDKEEKVDDENEEIIIENEPVILDFDNVENENVIKEANENINFEQNKETNIDEKNEIFQKELELINREKELIEREKRILEMEKSLLEKQKKLYNL